MSNEWKDICDCDVVDKERLVLFRKKLTEWKDIFIGDDIFSIRTQIQDLIWDDMIYRTFNEARRISANTNDPSTGLYGTIITLIDKTFFISQTMAVRRITDKIAYDPKRAVFSLSTLITDIENNVDLYTRENYVCHDGLVYKSEKDTDFRQKRTIERRHIVYDALSNISKGNRDRGDAISNSILNQLKKELGKTELIKSYTNKFMGICH